MNSILKTWIAESESWQAFIDFKLPLETIADYPFLRTPDDYFLSLMSNCHKILVNDEVSADVLSVAKGLEIFSLEQKSSWFAGIDKRENLLFAAGLYYLAGYSASAWILSNIAQLSDYTSPASRLVSGILRRSLDSSDEMHSTLLRFFATGDPQELVSLAARLEALVEVGLGSNPTEYSESLLAVSILRKLQNDNIWHDLLAINHDVDHWSPYVESCVRRKPPVWSFFPSQRLALKQGVLSNRTFSLQMPTSAGKTFVSEVLIYNEVKRTQSTRILYLAPFRALAAELKRTLAPRLAALGVTSKTVYGGNIPTVEERNSISTANLVISTPEKFMAIESIIPDFHEKFSTIICDEGHLLDDESRGLDYELLLTRFRNHAESARRFVFISAIIPNLDSINQWLGGDETTLLKSDYRPTQIEYAFLKRMTTSRPGYLLDVNPTASRPENYQLYRFLDYAELVLENPTSGSKYRLNSKKAISIAVTRKSAKAGSVALFCPTKRGVSGVEGLCEEMLKQLSWLGSSELVTEQNSSELSDATEYFSRLFHPEYLLVKSVVNGFVYHHGDLPQSVREIIEDLIRSSVVKVFVCTNTLAEGINLPIRCIVIHSTRRYDPSAVGRYRTIRSRDLKNLVGRVGRAGKETKGFVMVPHEDDFSTMTDLINETRIRPVQGQLFNLLKPLSDELVRLRLPITDELLDSLEGPFASLIEAIDVSIVDLLSEEVEIVELSDMIKSLVSSTFSYSQADETQRQTLESIFVHRAKKLEPALAGNYFTFLKKSGASIALFEQIQSHFDFTSDFWITEGDPTDPEFVGFILIHGALTLASVENDLDAFNTENGSEFTAELVQEIALLWMRGEWFGSICNTVGCEMHQLLRLLNSFISFSLQQVLSCTIRIAEERIFPVELSERIVDWPSMLQYGLNSELRLNIFELGLTDREAIIQLDLELARRGYSHQSYALLRRFLVNQPDIVTALAGNGTPTISVRNLEQFFRSLRTENML